MLVLATCAALALQAPPAASLSRSSSRRSVLLAAPLAATVTVAAPAHAFNPLDILFGWIPEVGCSSGEKCSAATAEAKATAAPAELSMAEKIRRRRKELEMEEERRRGTRGKHTKQETNLKTKR